MAGRFTRGKNGDELVRSAGAVSGCAVVPGAAVSDSDHKFYTGATDVSVSTNLPTRES